MLRRHAPSAKKRAAVGELPRGSSDAHSKTSYTDKEDSAVIVQAPIMPCLTVKMTLFAPFKSPIPGYVPGSSPLWGTKTLGAKKRRSQDHELLMTQFRKSQTHSSPSPPPAADPSGLVLFPIASGEVLRDITNTPLDESSSSSSEKEVHKVVVDSSISSKLRPHQVEGVKFLFRCVMGLNGYEGNGCILADDMGLGKTLQSITLLWTLLRQGLEKKVKATEKALIVCPASLVKNWECEIAKWVEGRCSVVALSESTQEKVLRGIGDFVRSPSVDVLIMSYETFRAHFSRLEACKKLDLVICDEAHRLKNDKTKTAQAISSLPTKRRVLLSGTPIQNDLDEFFAMINICNPGILGDASHFRQHFESPILAAREPFASPEEISLAEERLNELSTITNKFILRRTNTVLSKLLPPKVIQTVCCKLTPLQVQLYEHFLQSKTAKMVLNGKQTGVLSSITSLMKLCNHPRLIYPTHSDSLKGFEDIGQYFPADFSKNRRVTMPELSGKMDVVARMLANLRETCDDRIVLISNYTQTLDVFESLCRERGYPYMRLDGTTSITKRQKLVERFNDPSSNAFVFLLSSKAGGCGINLVGGNRLVLFDPDWNPANDKQAMARVWREGQKKKCYIYRMLSAGTIEEKIFQRQLAKDGLSNAVVNDASDGKLLSSEVLKDLFTLRHNTSSDTHEKLGCEACEELEGEELEVEAWKEQVGHPSEENLLDWSHHSSSETVADQILKTSGVDSVSFVLACEVEGKT